MGAGRKREKESDICLVLKIYSDQYINWVGFLSSWCDIFEFYKSSRECEWDGDGGVGWKHLGKCLVLPFYRTRVRSLHCNALFALVTNSLAH